MRIRIGLSFVAAAGESRLRDHVSRLISEHRTRHAVRHPRSVPREVTFAHVWRRASPMEELPTEWVEHRVLRRTRHSVLVEANPAVTATQHRPRHPNSRIPGYWIDQEELERLGFARVRTRKTIFFATPRVSDELVATLDSLVRLGLWVPYNEDDLKQSFRRLALQVHPDAGGSESRFIQLQDDFDRAAHALNNRWWSD